MEEYPPNSHAAARTARSEAKDVKRVTSAEATRRKKPLGKQFKTTFMGGDAKSTVQFVAFNVVLPAIKDMLVDAGSQAIERLIYGDTHRPRRGVGGAPSTYSQLGRVAYNQMSQSRTPQRSISSRARQHHDFGEILLESRVEATDVLDRMFDIISKFEMVTVADLYSLTGLSSSHVDHKWGWESLKGASVRRVRSGYLLDLPEPEYLE